MLVKRMRSKKAQVKSQNKLLFCSMCSYVATSYEELDHHYKLSHESDDDISTELEVIFANKKVSTKKAKTLKEKALKQLKLLVTGKDFHNEYLGWCTTKYYVGHIGNTITLLPYSTIC